MADQGAAKAGGALWRVGRAVLAALGAGLVALGVATESEVSAALDSWETLAGSGAVLVAALGEAWARLRARF